MVDRIYPLALVTGSAHRLGRIFALTLARQGYAILLHYYHSEEKATATADEIRALGVPVHLAQADLMNSIKLNSLFSILDTLPQKLCVLINSAAIMVRADVRNISVANWDETFKLNLRAPFLLAQQAAKRMTEGGLIINVTDIGATKAWTGFPAYAVSKAGLESLTRILGKAYGPKIRVNAIAPGLVLPSDTITPETWEKLVSSLPLKRPASEADITTTLEFLIKNKSVTGQTIVVDSGYSLI